MKYGLGKPVQIRLGVGFLVAMTSLVGRVQSAEIRFGRDILPVLAENCFACHGPDDGDRKAGLRLDTLEGATGLDGGPAAIEPGEPGASPLIERIESGDSDTVMPPPESHKPPLEAEQVALLKDWIEAGAPWGRHWSLESPAAPSLPEVDPATDHPIDAWILERLENEGLAPNRPASPRVRARRLAFALTGLPPEPADIERFAAEPTPAVWQSLVRKYLDSPHYGERMAMWWLDLARYSDSDGFQHDAARTNWPWRDWVISAFNDNMPFDQFTLEQFAGDLLPEPTPDQVIATAFHRNHMTNGEGGRDPEESRIDYVNDRVNTIGSTWLGTTLACARCHTHKYDPVSHADYFSLAAFFNSIAEDGQAGRKAKPYHKYKSPHVDRALEEARALKERLEGQLAERRQQAKEPFEEWLGQRIAEVAEGYEAWKAFGDRAWSVEGTKLVEEPETGGYRATGPEVQNDDYLVAGRVPEGMRKVTAFRLHVLPVPEEKRPKDAGKDYGALSRGGDGWFIVTNVKTRVRKEGESVSRDIDLAAAISDVEHIKSDDRFFGKIGLTLNDDARNGWWVRGAPPGEARIGQFTFAEPWVPADGEELVVEIRHRSLAGHANIARFRLELLAERGTAAREIAPTPLERLAGKDAEASGQVEGELRDSLFDQFLLEHRPFQEVRRQVELARAQLAEVERSRNVDVMVLKQREKARTTHVLVRGEWNKKGKEVGPRGIESIAPWPEGEPKNRIGLARWITSRENPLTARVIVNHIWTLMFGNGIVRTNDDFGLLGEHPTHPELLDTLAIEFMDSGWDVKALIELMVTSDAWQRDSSVTPGMLEADPQNRLLARGPRFRLPSWMLRDAALVYGGLINPAVGGPPVRPYQPEGAWKEQTMGRFTYVPSIGPAQYRRTIYAFWRRSSAPTFLFDSAQRRVCEALPKRSNTPLHALVMLNETTQLEAARALAGQVLGRFPDDLTGRLEVTFERVTGRAPEARELEVMQREYRRALEYWQENPREAGEFTRVGQQPSGKDAATTAATMLIVSMVMNLDEAIHHE